MTEIDLIFAVADCATQIFSEEIDSLSEIEKAEMREKIIVRFGSMEADRIACESIAPQPVTSGDLCQG